ncbi:LysR family transcriptional regulator [Pelagibacterium montanilacus]|uniref:LysR family transcriptional regulator n=1 Tax=Pelagibacterium montanilacus TaxID=2185280 RepID=UPI000F8F415A|nr:LysR family transcriptional regulator [Pelagibacterium montanilacus]
MDTSTLLLVDAVLAARSLRSAARLTGRPVSSLSAAVHRFEAAVSTTLCRRAGSGLVFTLEADRLAPALAQAARMVRDLYADPVDPFASTVRLQALARFVEVAERGSIRSAARALMLGQPQLTRQLAHLETALGHHLLIRGPEGTTLTPAGAMVRETCTGLLKRWRKVSRTSDVRFRRTQATVRLGSIMPLGHESEIARQLARLTASWVAIHPSQPLFVSSTTAEELFQGLKSGTFDVALVDTVHLPDDLDGARIAISPLAVIGASGPDIAAALRTSPIALPSPRSGLRLRIDRLLEMTFEEPERDRLNLLEIDSIPVILNLVLHYGFVSVLPLASITAIRPELSRIALPRDFDMHYWLCWLRAPGRPTAGAAVLDAMQRADSPQ